MGETRLRSCRSLSLARDVRIVTVPTCGWSTMGWTGLGGQWRCRGSSATSGESRVGASERSAAAGSSMSIVSGRAIWYEAE